MQTTIRLATLAALMGLTSACDDDVTVDFDAAEAPVPAARLGALRDHTIPDGTQGADDGDEDGGGVSAEPLCAGDRISAEGVAEMLELTTLSDAETVYTTYDRIDAIAGLFEDCGDPWGMFPTT